MAVLKVMFTALVTAMMGLSIAIWTGLVDPATQIYYMTTYYGTYVVAGLIFGAGFVMSGWCPGTAAVGMASGKIDAVVFLGGAMIGSILFNELFPIIKPIYTWGQSSLQAYGQPGLGLSARITGRTPAHGGSGNHPHCRCLFLGRGIY